jgi:amidohydrolase
MIIESVNNIENLVNEVKDEVVIWRRFLHRNPEISFQEEKTSDFVYETLISFGNLEVSRPTKTSVMARLLGEHPGKVLAIRADMDALPITEENTFEFVSRNPGVMHACGHDGHTAVLLGTAKILSSLKAQVKGEVRFLFQHAEETLPGGAEEMVQAGVMDGVDLVIGQHLWSPMETGKIGIGYGPVMASMDTFYLTIQGKGGHAAMPHQTIDSIVIATQVVSNLQQIVSRNIDPIDPVVLSVTKFIGGTTHNVIPDTVEIVGTTRTLNSSVRESLPQRMEEIIEGITKAHHATYTFKYDFGYRPVDNDQSVTSIIEEIARKVVGNQNVIPVRPTMGGEDFSAYQQKAPGTFFFVGAGNVDKGIIYPHHHPKFTIDEDSLEIALKMFLEATFEFLSE